MASPKCRSKMSRAGVRGQRSNLGLPDSRFRVAFAGMMVAWATTGIFDQPLTGSPRLALFVNPSTIHELLTGSLEWHREIFLGLPSFLCLDQAANS
jgi:hypothetical protein